MASIRKAASTAVAALALLPTLAWSDVVGELNTFEAGEKARASEVNENFDAVAEAVEGTRVTSNKGKRFEAEVLTADEILALLSQCSTRAPTGQRNSALIVLLWRAGLRCSEALDLFPKDIDPKAHTVRVLNGKGRKARTVGLDATAFAVIARWLDTRKSLGIKGRKTLLCTLKGGKLKTSYVRALMPRLAAKAHIDRRVHAHALRHTHAVELLREGVLIPTISRQLGHSSIAVTAAYLDHLEPADVIEALQSREWPTATELQ